jgi:putative phosphoesterase
VRIGVISDTHGVKIAIEQAVSAAGMVDMWLHAGDFRRDAAYLTEMTGLPTVAVDGNCDDWASAQDELLEVAGRKIWLTHGHHYHVKKGTAELARKARERRVDVVVFGHTHIPTVHRHGDIVLLNPGSAAYPNSGFLPTYGILAIADDGTIDAAVHQI